ncbi:CDP-diacylglycerol--serine O-phosphatidyltransferase [Bacillus pseudomycoides]|uniref:CDP-diacylglycerol--serine O-phosphatidyltransferase n=1 Tax=Bacillus pseudomycoides TaxID=64104 RepID=A0AA91VDQ7_9BACI|nr:MULTISPECIES: CDP-diacylglycerol--serine O-phosphatidyltransferase [Bacillus]PEB52705.1 CDP-diacylglycerol--serine O-phosphatidyltransferase [Bacillus sp. AFS098217]PED83167.1 CDP-diacylglycerol--serine O-phosphatidyltransferase [Bacillus pseudomycoides]PEU14020.1 CDP-diacylglycerol--serine O-phosphatidyltransferase [Bacillus sp. AFS019443]PEU17662.1 CDP-diacylglycerol--serine O-phosphatidyltransferase [Bacillus sp. AFS014408]PFW62348.1 CDP-diacylglycerol--serine O-phosphatidyltransferase [
MYRAAIPNLFTLGNLYSGFLSIGYASLGYYKSAAILVLIGMMLDSLDGRVARLLRVDSQMGKELDSLADVVTFGAAPAVLMYYTSFSNYGIIGLYIAGLFPLFGAYRLARFNVTPSSTSMKYFTGVPITAAGGLVAFLTLFSHTIPKIVLITVFVTFAFLMVSRIRIPSLKDVPIPRYSIIITLFLIGIIYTMYKTSFGNMSVFLFIAIPLYILYMLSQFLRQRPAHKNRANKEK